MRDRLRSLGKCIAIAMAMVSPGAVAAEQIGYGRLFVNDFLGDGHDRWRSGSIAASHIFAQDWHGQLPTSAGEVLELRVLGQVIAPSNLRTPATGDRKYAAALSLGLHTHFQREGTEFALGSDLTVVGPQNGLADIQSALHDVFGIPAPSDAVLNAQIGNQIIPGFVAEVGREVAILGTGRLRPFFELRISDENLMRAGVDFVLGELGADELWVRDPVTGFRYRTVQNAAQGRALVLGADVTYVDDSVYLPSTAGPAAETYRARLRAGLHHQGKKASVFYGLSWLSSEFSGQSSGQTLGAIRIKYEF